MKILLIEDDMETVESIRLCLEIYEPDIELISTNKGLDALEMLKEGDFEGAIVDLGLPDIDGTVVIEKLRSFSSIPVVVLSARYSPEVISQAMSMGANEYITKPFNYRFLLKRLNELVKNSPEKRGIR
jgi:two-component system KDP operon response regulator KdpE